MRFDADILDELRIALRDDAAGVAEALLGAPNKALSSRSTLRWGAKGSVAVELHGSKRGLWFSHESTEGGDLLSLVRHVRGCSFPDALAWARSHTGLDAPDEFDPAEDRARRERQDADRRARQAEQAAKDDADEVIRIARRIARAQTIARESVPIAGTVAEIYLVQTRGIPRPASGWPDSVRFHAASRSLVVIATTAGGVVQAVQQVHLDERGRKISAEEMPRRGLPAIKMTTGPLAGAAVRLPGAEAGPLLVAEGPETGLAVWAATSHATWIALGAVGKVQIPAGRRVVIASDDNPAAHLAKEGGAARSLRKALDGWKAAGHDVVVATPWAVRRRDKSDFADLILAGGPQAVRARFQAVLEPQAARTVRVPLAEARRQVAAAVGAFFDRVDAISVEKVGHGESSGSANDTGLGTFDGEWADDAPVAEPQPANFVHGIRVDVGVGKSHEARRHIARTLAAMRARGDNRTIVLAVPMHALGDEQAAAFLALPEVQVAGLRVAVWRGRAAPDPSHPSYADPRIKRESKVAMCRDLERVEDAQSVGLHAQTTCCVRIVELEGKRQKVFCPLFDGCAYQAQLRTEADLWITSHDLLFHETPAAMGEIAAVVVDEGAWRKGLIGAEGRPLTVSFDTISSDCTVHASKELKDRTATARLENLRGQLLQLVDRLPNGPIRRDALAITTLTNDSCAEAEKLEWRRKLDALHPGLSRKDRKAAIEKLAGNRTIRRMTMTWSSLRLMLSPDAPEASGWIEIGVEPTRDGPVRVLRLKGRSGIREGWQVPTLLLDALLPIDLVQAYWPEAVLMADVRAQMPHQRVRQVIDRAYSKAMLEPLNDADTELNPEEAQRRQNRLVDMRAILVREALAYAPGQVLAVLQQSVEEALHKLGRLPSNLVTAHHNAIAGRDEWRDVAAVIVVGRTLPPPSAVEHIAEALTGAAVEKSAKWYERWADAVREMADGRLIPAGADRHVHPLAEDARWQIAEGELLQIVGRGRGVNRTAANPLDILILTDVPLPLPLVGTLGAAELTPSPADYMLAAGGMVLENPTDAALAYPNLWGNRDAAKKAFQRGKLGTFPYVKSIIGKSPQLRKIDYQAAGQGKSASGGGFDPDLCPEPLAFLTRALGPLVWCKIDGEDQPLAAETDAPAADAVHAFVVEPAASDKMSSASGSAMTPHAARAPFWGGGAITPTNARVRQDFTELSGKEPGQDDFPAVGGPTGTRTTRARFNPDETINEEHQMDDSVHREEVGREEGGIPVPGADQLARALVNADVEALVWRNGAGFHVLARGCEAGVPHIIATSKPIDAAGLPREVELMGLPAGAKFRLQQLGEGAGLEQLREFALGGGDPDLLVEDVWARAVAGVGGVF